MNEQLRQRFCKFFGTPRGCFSGNNCKFLHPEGTGSFPQGSAHSSGGKTFLLLYVIKGHSCIWLVWPRLACCFSTLSTMLQGNVSSLLSSLLGSTPGGSITGSFTEKRPSNPFVLQGQGVQLGDIPSTLFQGNHQTNQIGSEALPRLSRTKPANSVPFTEMPNPGSSQVPFRAETSISSEVSFKR